MTELESALAAIAPTLVLTACALSFLFLGGLHGVREGTVAAALCVGLVAKQMNRLLGRLWKK